MVIQHRTARRAPAEHFLSCEFDTVVDDLDVNSTLLDNTGLQGNVIHHNNDCFPLLIFY